MKKFLVLSIAALMLVSVFSACSQKPEDSDSQSSEASESSSSAIASQPSYTESEAAEINKGIADGDISFVQFEGPDSGSETAVIKTSMGNIRVILYRELAPKAVENFVTHAENGYYTGLSLNNVAKNFIIEGGAPDDNGGESIFGDSANPYFENEYSLDLWNFRGAFGMSNVTGQNENGSQFYIVQAPFVDAETIEAMEKAAFPQSVIDFYDDMGGVPGFDGNRTVFGMIYEEDMSIIDAIARVPVDENGRPEKSIVIDSITVTSGAAEIEADPDEDEDGEAES